MSRSPIARSGIASSLGALLMACGLLALAAVGPTPVRAHAELVSSSPEANASLLEPPSEIRLRFSEPIDRELAFADLLDATQTRVEGIPPAAADQGGTELTIQLPDLDAGTYTVTYQVVSAVDGHATTGVFAFVVDPTGTEPPPAVPPGSTSPSVDGWTVAGRWLGLGGALVALGSMLTWWRARPMLAGGKSDGPPWALVAPASLVAVGGVAAYLTLAARPILEAAPSRAAGWPLDVAAPFGTTAFAIAMRVALAAGAVAALLALAGWIASARRWSGALGVAVVGSLALALGGMSAAGHAAAAGGPAFAAVDWLHLVAVAAWLGGLPAVALLARRLPDGGAGARGILQRHGGVALVAAPLVALTGIANSPLVLGQARELVGSDYGNLLLAKALLLSVAVGIGTVNFLVLRGRGRASIGWLVGVEVAVAAVAVGMAATMVTIQPAAARGPVPTAAPVTPAHLFGEAGPSSIHATVNLPMPGVQSYQVTVTDGATGAPRDDVQAVFLEFEPPTAATPHPERATLNPHRERPGLFTGSGAFLSVEGEWSVEVVVRREGALDERVAFGVPVRQPSPPRLVPPPDTGIGVPAPIGALWALLPRGPTGWLPALLATVALSILVLAPRGRRSRAASIGRVVALGILAVSVLGAGSRALVAAANAPSREALAEHAPPPAFVPTSEEGEVLYRANCAACHGTDGRGDGPVRTLPPAGALAQRLSEMTSAELSYRIANGYAGTAMPPFAASLTEAERWNLVRYLENRWR